MCMWNHLMCHVLTNGPSVHTKLLFSSNEAPLLSILTRQSKRKMSSVSASVWTRLWVKRDEVRHALLTSKSDREEDPRRRQLSSLGPGSCWGRQVPGSGNAVVLTAVTGNHTHTQEYTAGQIVVVILMMYCNLLAIKRPKHVCWWPAAVYP